jgi:hypothetical protein
MRDNDFTTGRTAMLVIAAAAGLLLTTLPLRAQTSAGGAATSVKPSVPKVVVKTAWGEPDLQGIWRDDYQNTAAAAGTVRQPGVPHGRGTEGSR